MQPGRQIHRQGDGRHVQQHTADPLKQLLPVTGKQAGHHTDEIGGLGVSEKIAEGQDGVDAQVSADKGHIKVDPLAEIVHFLISCVIAALYVQQAAGRRHVLLFQRAQTGHCGGLALGVPGLAHRLVDHVPQSIFCQGVQVHEQLLTDVF